MASLASLLASHARQGELWEPVDSRRIRCHACGHQCPVFEGQSGVCKVRFNQGGKLYVPWGYVAGLQCDPIEKKPFLPFRHRWVRGHPQASWGPPARVPRIRRRP